MFPHLRGCVRESVRQPVSFRAASRRCRARLTRQCRRLGVLALEVCPEPSDDDGAGDYPDDSPGGAFPTTTTTTPRFPTTTTTLPLETGALVGGYQFIGKTDYLSRAGHYAGEPVVIPFTVEAQSGDSSWRAGSARWTTTPSAKSASRTGCSTPRSGTWSAVAARR